MTAIRAVVITASDACARGEREDASGAALVQLLTDLGAEIVATKILSDDLDPLIEALIEFADRDDVNLIITTGGTGLGPRDNTPEATLAVIEREAPGLAEAMRNETLKQTPMAMISRGVAPRAISTFFQPASASAAGFFSDSWICRKSCLPSCGPCPNRRRCRPPQSRFRPAGLPRSLPAFGVLRDQAWVQDGAEVAEGVGVVVEP